MGGMWTKEQLPQGWGRERTFPRKVQLRSVGKTTAALMYPDQCPTEIGKIKSI